jgi:RNA polymerase sigma-70 factor (ECF subfamily)
MGGLRGRREQAFEDFCRNEYGRLVAAVALILGSRDLAADAVNEALARAWIRTRRGETLDPLGAWVRVVALNFARDQLRHRAVEHKHAPTIFATSNTGVDDASWGTSVDIRRALSALPPRQREVAVLHYLCDLSVNDIAHELRIASGTVKTTLQHARAALRVSLQDTSKGVANRDAS